MGNYNSCPLILRRTASQDRGHGWRRDRHLANDCRVWATRHCPREISRNSQRNLAFADGFRGVTQSFGNILLLEVGISGKDFRFRHTIGNQADDRCHRDAKASDAGHPTHFFRFDRDTRKSHGAFFHPKLTPCAPASFQQYTPEPAKEKPARPSGRAGFPISNCRRYSAAAWGGPSSWAGIAFCCSSWMTRSRSVAMWRRRAMAPPVPAGIRRPTITFSFRPSSMSTLPLTAASVRTRVVSWNDAAENTERVCNEALVMPSSTGRPSAGLPPSSSAFLLASSISRRSTCSPASNVVSPPF